MGDLTLSQEDGRSGSTDGMDVVSRESSLHGPTVTISATNFAVTVLTFEGTPLNILRRGSLPPVYAHHAVVWPQSRQSITTDYTRPFSLPPFMVYRSKMPLSAKCCVSVTVVPAYQVAEYLSEVKYRKKYGLIGQMQWEMLKSKDIPCVMQWKLLRQTNHIHIPPLKMKKFVYTLPLSMEMSSLDHDATEYYACKLLQCISSICKLLEPIVID